jgi:hypothetical protein
MRGNAKRLCIALANIRLPVVRDNGDDALSEVNDTTEADQPP